MSTSTPASFVERLRRLCVLSMLALVPAAVLAGCVTAPGAPQLRPAAQADAEAPDADASTYGLYLAGSAALDRGESRDAAFYLSRASAQAPGSALIEERAFAAALVAGDVDRAAALAALLPPRTAGDDQSAFVLGLLTRASVDMAQGRGREAYALLSGSPPGVHSAAVTLLKPWAAAQAGDVKASVAPPSTQEHAAAAFGGLGQAALLERAGDLASADAAYKAQASRGGVFALAYGGFLERRARRSEAIAFYDRGLAKDPTDPAFGEARARAAGGLPPPPLATLRQGAAEALIGPAALLLTAKQGDAGLAYLRLALRLNPQMDEAWVLVGDAMDSAGDPVAARDAYGKVRPASAEYATAQGRLALLLHTGGDKAGALALARATLQSHPDDPQALVVLADLLRDDDRYEEAVKVLDRLIAKVGGDSAAAWRLYYLRGASLERAGRWDAAQMDLQRALQLKPDDPEVLNYLGFAWADRGEHLHQALGLLEKATVLDPQDGAVIDSLGWVHYRLGDYRNAVRELELAVSLDPADPEVNDHLGDAYWRSGRRLEARYQWSRVLTLGPDAGRRASAQSKLGAGLKPVASASPQL